MRDVKSAGKQVTKRDGKKVIARVEIEPVEKGGHIVTHHHEQNGAGYIESEKHVFGKGEGKKMMAHIAKHMGVEHGVGPGTMEKTTADEKDGEDSY